MLEPSFYPNANFRRIYNYANLIFILKIEEIVFLLFFSPCFLLLFLMWGLMPMFALLHTQNLEENGEWSIHTFLLLFFNWTLWKND